MKNVLFATTALIATAGIASAEVSLSGSAEMGIVGGETADGITRYTTQGSKVSNADQFHTDIDVTFTLSGESDNGITFGATIDLDEEGGFDSTNGGPEAVFISGDFGTLTMGDTDGALDNAVAENDVIGDIADSSTTFSNVSFGNVDGLEDNDGQVARFDYSIAGFGLSLSAEADDEGTNRNVWGFGATYSIAGYNLGAGYQGGEASTSETETTLLADLVTGEVESTETITDTTTNFEQWAFSAGTSFGPVDVMANYGEYIENINSGKDIVTLRYSTGVTYSMDALTVGVMYGEEHTDGDSNVGRKGETEKGFGIAANYDLGGGLVLQAGYGEGVTEALNGMKDPVETSYSLGLSMSF